MFWLNEADKNIMRHCKICNKELLHNEVALNEKLLGKGLMSFFCLDCLAEYLDTTREDLEKMTMQFIKDGCIQFKKN
ncbi:MAG: hypothetical protein RR233_08010 [Clostridiales bacterium]